MLESSPVGIPQEYRGNLTAYMGWDNERMEAMLREVTGLADQLAWEPAQAQFDAFALALDRHIRIEEEIVFPLFERALGVTPGRTVVMCREHDEILDAANAISGALGRHKREAVQASLSDLDDVLGPHNLKEERVIYPVADRALTPLERRRMLDHLLAYR